MTEKEMYTQRERERPQWGEPDKTRHVRHTLVTRKLAFSGMPPTSASLRLLRFSLVEEPLN